MGKALETQRQVRDEERLKNGEMGVVRRILNI